MCVYHCAREGTIENREWKIGTREWKIGTREWKIGRRECSLEERTGKIERNLSQRKAFIKPWSQLGRERKQRLLKDILGTLQNVADHYDTSVICASSPQVQLLVNAISLFEMWRNLLFAICWSPSLNFLWLANGLLCSAQHISCLILRSLAFSAFSELKAQLKAKILSELKENPFFSKDVRKGSCKKTNILRSG